MIFVALAAILGGGGVTLAALAAHVEDSVAIRAAAELAMVHAVAVIALVAFARHNVRYSVVWSVVTAAMLIGASLFTSAVALAALADLRPIPGAAPIGGSLTILSWLGVFVAALLEWMGESGPAD